MPTTPFRTTVSGRLPTTISGSLPKPAWLAVPEEVWPSWRLSGDTLAQGKLDATLMWLKQSGHRRSRRRAWMHGAGVHVGQTQICGA